MFKPKFTLDAAIYPDFSREPIYMPTDLEYTPETDGGILDSLNWFDDLDEKTIAIIPIKYCEKEFKLYGDEFTNLPTWIPVEINQDMNDPLVIQTVSQQCFGYPYIVTLYPKFIEQQITFGPSSSKVWTKEIVEEMWKNKGTKNV